MHRRQFIAGAAGLIIEVHHQPDRALSDAAQTVDCGQFATIAQAVRGVAATTARYYA